MSTIKARDLFELQHLSKLFGRYQNFLDTTLSEDGRKIVVQINQTLANKTGDLKDLSRMYSDLAEVADDHLANICRQLSDLLIDIEK